MCPGIKTPNDRVELFWTPTLVYRFVSVADELDGLCAYGFSFFLVVVKIEIDSSAASLPIPIPSL